MNLNLYDKDLNRISIIGGQYVSCFWSEGYNTVGSFSLELIATDEYKKKVKSDCYVGRDDRKTLMVIKTVEIVNGKIVASGKQATRILDDVSFVGTIKSGQYVDKAIIEAYNKSEAYRNTAFSESDLKIKYNHQISDKSFLELCEIMCQDTDVGFRTIRKNGIVTTEFYQPKYNENIVLSEKFGNISIDSIAISTENLKNYAIVLGETNEGERAKVIVDLTNGSERRDLIIDARDLQSGDNETSEEYALRLKARGIEKLLKCQQTFECAFFPNEQDFGSKYDLGDIVRIYLNDYGITLQSRVSRFTQKSKNNRTETIIEVGQITIKR